MIGISMSPRMKKCVPLMTQSSSSSEESSRFAYRSRQTSGAGVCQAKAGPCSASPQQAQV
jgi:hypothetical protein